MVPYFILDGHRAIPCSDVVTWAKWFQSNGRIVEQTQVGIYWVSTVFLGIDHNFGQGDPLLFETMIFVDGESEDMERYFIWEEAEQGHARHVKLAKEKQAKIETQSQTVLAQFIPSTKVDK